MIIKNTTKLGSLLLEYPQLGMSISAILPEFGSLEQPQLKETVLSITTIEHLANKTGREVSVLIGTLNSVLGFEGLADKENKTIEYKPEDPDWIKQEPAQFVDGVELLLTGEHPLEVIKELLKDMSPGETVFLKTNFPPQPMIDAMEKAGVDIYSRLDLSDSNLFLTFIRR